MQKTKKVFVVYYGDNQWKLTDDENEARQLDSDYMLATLDDLDDWGCVGGFYKDNVIEIEDGCFKWEEKSYIDKYGRTEHYGDYELVE